MQCSACGHHVTESHGSKGCNYPDCTCRFKYIVPKVLIDPAKLPPHFRVVRGSTEYAAIFFSDRVVFAELDSYWKSDSGKLALRIILAFAAGLALPIVLMLSNLGINLGHAMGLGVLVALGGSAYAFFAPKVGDMKSKLLLYSSSLGRAPKDKWEEYLYSLREMNPEQILSAKADNFQVLFDEISNIEFLRTYSKRGLVGLRIIEEVYVNYPDKWKWLAFDTDGSENFDRCWQLAKQYMPDSKLVVKDYVKRDLNR